MRTDVSRKWGNNEKKEDYNQGSAMQANELSGRTAFKFERLLGSFALSLELFFPGYVCVWRAKESEGPPVCNRSLSSQRCTGDRKYSVMNPRFSISPSRESGRKVAGLRERREVRFRPPVQGASHDASYPYGVFHPPLWGANQRTDRCLGSAKRLGLVGEIDTSGNLNGTALDPRPLFSSCDPETSMRM
ncbi:hypothetical protein CIRG_03670 [Coccidioides immitis RMSCC 2394]|uniref:Uncharacterized protein n=1 Tax=Coccidioides immitis RMSCC 2394 TaxID=404692 RepID=A0A0J6YAZ3_COCIT|nr:hypothetical protein CIRG_03670 [Coccidioides immitis RMSCC 2394]